MANTDPRCPYCGQYLALLHPDHVRICGRENITPTGKMPMGWICPRCERVNSPSAVVCICSPPQYKGMKLR